MKKCLLILIMSIFITLDSFAQPSEFKNQRAQLAVFNIGFNGLIGGLGSRDEKASFQVFAKGFCKWGRY